MSMNILHLLVSGEAGGIETYNKDIFLYSKHRNYFCFVFSGGCVASEMQQLGAQTFMLNIPRSYYLNRILNSLRGISQKEKIDVVVVHHASPIFWIAGYYLKKKENIPFYIYAHGNIDLMLLIHSPIKSFIRKKIFEIAYPQAKGIIAISNAVYNSIIKKYPNAKEKISIIYNGIDIKKFSKFKDKDQDKMLNILYVGRLVPEKGVNILLEAIGLINKNLDLHCDIIGDGPERTRLENLVEKLNLKKHVTFYGVQRNIPEWHQKATVFVHPVLCEEGFGITLVEAMASSLPCITFNKGAIPEIIRDGKNGFILEQDNAESLARAIRKVSELIKCHPKEWHIIKQNAVMTAEKYNIFYTVDKLDKLFA